MDHEIYLSIFREVAEELVQQELLPEDLSINAGIFLDSVCIKLYKKQWTNQIEDPLTAKTRIFCSVWINDQTIIDQKIRYNIHALKLRELKGYAIQSRKFAEQFRLRFQSQQHTWENVNINLGPLTLMEGSIPLYQGDLKRAVLNLTSKFSEIIPLIDDTLEAFKKS